VTLWLVIQLTIFDPKSKISGLVNMLLLTNRNVKMNKRKRYSRRPRPPDSRYSANKKAPPIIHSFGPICIPSIEFVHYLELFGIVCF